MTKNSRPAPDKTVSTLKNNLPSLLLLLAGFLAGIIWLGAVRFWLVKPAAETHYHANFAVYVDGQREEFESFTYYEEIAACTTAFADNPKGRSHLHDNESDVIHVEDRAVTYADFFDNIDWTLGPNFVRTANGLITNTSDRSWTFILNGKKLDRVDNIVIGDQDKLLVSYGAAGTDFQSQYNKIENKAEAEDAGTDPASCGGLNGPADTTFGGRLKRAFSVNQ